MENKINKEQFCGIDLYNWKEWDEIDTDNLYFYNVKFLIPSMKKYDNMDVSRFLMAVWKFIVEKVQKKLFGLVM